MQSHTHHGGRVFVGIVLMLAGLAILARNTGILPIGSLWEYWPALLIVIGVAKLLNARTEPAEAGKEDVHGT